MPSFQIYDTAVSPVTLQPVAYPGSLWQAWLVPWAPLWLGCKNCLAKNKLCALIGHDLKAMSATRTSITGTFRCVDFGGMDSRTVCPWPLLTRRTDGRPHGGNRHLLSRTLV